MAAVPYNLAHGKSAMSCKYFPHTVWQAGFPKSAALLWWGVNRQPASRTHIYKVIMFFAFKLAPAHCTQYLRLPCRCEHFLTCNSSPSASTLNRSGMLRSFCLCLRTSVYIVRSLLHVTTTCNIYSLYIGIKGVHVEGSGTFKLLLVKKAYHVMLPFALTMRKGNWCKAPLRAFLQDV